MRTAYQVLASQYDPLGFMVPFTNSAKVLIQQLWSKQRGWDNPDLPPALQKAWESELKHINSVSIPRCHFKLKAQMQRYALHIICDAWESIWSSVCKETPST